MSNCKDKLASKMDKKTGEGWFYVNRGSVEFYTTHEVGKAATFVFHLTRRRLESILKRMDKAPRRPQ